VRREEQKGFKIRCRKNKTYYVKPRHVSTSTVKKSVPASTSICRRMNSFQVVV
jgi:hypothetical protein